MITKLYPIIENIREEVFSKTKKRSFITMSRRARENGLCGL